MIMDVVKQNPEIQVFLSKAVSCYVVAIKQRQTYMTVSECYKMYDDLKKATSLLVSMEIDKCRIELFDNTRSVICESSL